MVHWMWQGSQAVRMPAFSALLMLVCAGGLVLASRHGGVWLLDWVRWLGLLLIVMSPTLHVVAVRGKAPAPNTWGVVSFLVGLLLVSVDLFTRAAALVARLLFGLL